MINESLLNSILNKKHGAFTIFYNDIVDHFYSYLKSNFSISENDIYDIISNTFVKIWNKLDSFDKTKGNFETWVWTILRNTTKDFFKKRKEYVFSDFEYSNSDGDKMHLEDTIIDEDDYMDIIEKDYKLEEIKTLMEDLSMSEKEILYLRYTEGKQLSEIASIVGISEGNVRVKLHRLVKKIKSKVK